MLRTVEDLAGHTIAIDAAAPGRELSRLFELHPGLPGVLIRKKGQVETAISYQQFLKQIVRPFGAELYLGRPVEILVTHLDSRLLEIDSGTPITDAVQRCLSRRSDLLYEPFLVRSTESALIVDFQTLLLALTDQLSARNQQMDLILSAVSAGLLVIDRSFHIGEEYSRALTAMLEQQSLGGQSLIELLATFTDEKTASQAKEYLAIVFNPRVIDRLIRSINPLREVEARFDSGARSKILNFAFERLRSGHEISHLLVSVEDVTENVRLTRELAAQQERAEHRLKIILQILEIEPEDLNPFLHRFEALLSLARATVGSVSPDQPEFARQLYRTAHALKGEAGVLGLTVFQEAIHEFEERLRNHQEQKSEETFAAIGDGLLRLDQLNTECTGAIRQMQKLSGDHPERGPAAGFLTRWGNLVATLAERRGKKCRFVSDVEEEKIPGKYLELLRDVVPQLLRNAVIHGIEPPAERESLGKQPSGTIQFSRRDYPDWIEFVVQDDGRGVDHAAVLKQATLAGLSGSDARLLIFAPSVSTAGTTTMDAGRGVGLDLVKDKVEAGGGRIEVFDQAGTFCAFQILLPARGME